MAVGYKNSERLIHVVPLNDLREHVPQTDCWCNPTPDMEEPSVILHHSLDQREKYESGELRAH
jgi:hypothetical protein